MSKMKRRTFSVPLNCIHLFSWTVDDDLKVKDLGVISRTSVFEMVYLVSW